MQPAINDILRDEITKLNYTLVPPGFRGDPVSIRQMQQLLSKIIDDLGEKSATAQGLNKIITTTEKLRNSPTHTLYLLKDPNYNNNGGQVIGLLKVGHKKLFLYDRCAQVLETEPLCVLDFFVLRERQRHGYGKQLFDHMLQDQGVSATQLAIDGPSEKMITFMRKNYVLSSFVRQANNFAVAPEFFQHEIGGHRESLELKSPGRTTSSVGRCSAPKPPSSIGNIIHGGNQHHLQRATSGYEHMSLTPTGRYSPMQPRSTIGMVIHGDHPQSKHTTTTGVWYVGETPRHTPEPAPPSDSPGGNWAGAAAGATVGPPERPSTLQIDVAPPAGLLAPAPPPPAPVSPAPEQPGAGATTHRRDSQVTDQGFFDIKFYHNKIW